MLMEDTTSGTTISGGELDFTNLSSGAATVAAMRTTTSFIAGRLRKSPSHISLMRLAMSGLPFFTRFGMGGRQPDAYAVEAIALPRFRTWAMSPAARHNRTRAKEKVSTFSLSARVRRASEGGVSREVRSQSKQEE